MKQIKITNSKEETQKLAKLIANYLHVGSLITLQGDLGVGKTVFASGIALGLDIDEKVSSPTFNIMKCYFSARIPMFHIDAYRLEDGNKDIGLEEFIEGDGVCLIEWPKFISELIDFNKALNVEIVSLGDNARQVILQSENVLYKELFERLGEE